MNPTGLSIGFSVTLFLILLSIFSIRYELEKRGKRRDESDWLLSDFSGRVYSALFGNKDPKILAVKLKIDIRGYVSDCEILGREADFYRLVIHYVYGIIILVLCIIIACFTDKSIVLLGVFSMCYLCVIEKKIVHKRAEGRRHQIEEELPRFLDLLRTELNVGMPIETAVYVICKRTDTLLSKEFFLALRKMEFGANEWGEALEDIARKYNVDLLSSFVLNVVTAYRKGVSVANAVDRQYRELHKDYVLNVKDRAETTKSAVLLPMFLLQLFPLIAFIALPLFMTLMQFM